MPKTEKMYVESIKFSILEIEQKSCVDWFNETNGNSEKVDDVTMIHILILMLIQVEMLRIGVI